MEGGCSSGGSLPLINVARWTQDLRRTMPCGGTMHILPGLDGTEMTQAARNAGLRVIPLPFTRWPMPHAVATWGYNRVPPGMVVPVGQAETEFHNAVRDQVARDIGRGRGAIMEVELSTPLTSFSARADIIAQGRQEAGDTSQVIVEIKTGPSSEFTVNQSYIYALALVGGHLTSPDHRLPSVGLMPGTPLPKMDLLLLCTDGPGQAFRPYVLRAAEVDSADTLAAVMAAIRAFR